MTIRRLRLLGTMGVCAGLIACPLLAAAASGPKLLHVPADLFAAGWLIDTGLRVVRSVHGRGAVEAQARRNRGLLIHRLQVEGASRWRTNWLMIAVTR